ncbi:hypothetical protein BDV25DRAFT_31335 [Aspergillus avenaceus]|uniref:Mid2 domain-containing protein n=1 Tax=Aspergillus avenaceus TaxID=36643 RepID=A0A5N6U435_ASPAV|nr:hypothetical protein BDV25DRAFT_31335 [Aspergillus avenaceus]
MQTVDRLHNQLSGSTEGQANMQHQSPCHTLNCKACSWRFENISVSLSTPTNMSASVASVLPLTTTFVPPSSCVSNIYKATSQCSGTHCDYTWLNLGPASTAECLPSGWGPTSFFSPGLCPSGYGIASSVQYTTGNVTETHATCCPVAFETYSIRPSTPATYPWYATEPCQWQPTEGVTVFNFTYQKTDNRWTYATGSLDTKGLVNAYGVSIRWQSTDFTSPTSTSAVATSSIPTVETTSQVTQPKGSSGLSDDAKAGIGVGVAVGVLWAIGLVFGIYFFRRKPPRGIGEPANNVAEASYHELGGVSPGPRVHEMEGGSVVGRPGARVTSAAELDGLETR